MTRAAVLLGAWLAFATTATAAPFDPAPLDRTVVASGLAGTVAVTDRERVVYERATGLADRERRRPHRVDERWLWASVTKQVTAVLVLQEVERGRLALDTPVPTILRGFPHAVTVRQLLTHTSGLPNPDDTPKAADGIPRFHRERGAKIGDTYRARGYCAGPRKTVAGFAYNNCDYLVLAALLERINGVRYADLVRTRIAERSGARTLRVALDGQARAGADPVGYEDATKRYPPLNVATFGAAGALVGTTRDLLAFDRALLANRLLSPGSMRVLWTGDPKLGYAALGAWAFAAPLAGCAEPVRLVERRGDVGGTQVRNVIAPDLGLAIVVFTNDASVDFGEVWQGKGLTFDLLSAAFCRAK